MKLYTTPTSPYGRIVRIAVIEKGLQDRVGILPARTRTERSPYYDVNPSGRVPYLVRDDGTGLEDSRLIAAWLDHLGGGSTLFPAGEAFWEHERLEALARSFLDGIALLLREFRRPADERSPTIIEHERARAARLAAFWEREVAHPLMQGPLNMSQIVLAVALDLDRDDRMPGLPWRANHPDLVAWLAERAGRPSMEAVLAGP